MVFTSKFTGTEQGGNKWNDLEVFVDTIQFVGAYQMGWQHALNNIYIYICVCVYVFYV